jgi:hypothetical protein
MEHIKISVSVLNDVLAYLGKRPYEEVFNHVVAIQKEAEAFIKSIEQDVINFVEPKPEEVNPAVETPVVEQPVVPAISPEPIPVPSPAPVSGA